MKLTNVRHNGFGEPSIRGLSIYVYWELREVRGIL